MSATSPPIYGAARSRWRKTARGTRQTAHILKRLDDLQRVIQRTVARHVGAGNGELPVLYTEVSREKEDGLKELHRLCDWVITLDRNAGIEYFDSPQDNQTIYDAYVIDCVPEREDLGCLQLITSTSNLEEVRVLIDSALDQMGLSRSRRNAKFLLEHLKALSGRLAIRLTGDKPPTSELIALAVSQANCQQAQETDPCWVSLERGFIVPVDDVRDLLPPLTDKDGDEREVRPDLIYVTTAPRKGTDVPFRGGQVPSRSTRCKVAGHPAPHSGTDQCATQALGRMVFA